MLGLITNQGIHNKASNEQEEAVKFNNQNLWFPENTLH